MISGTGSSLQGIRVRLEVHVTAESGEAHAHQETHGSLGRVDAEGGVYWVPDGRADEEIFPWQNHLRHALKSLDCLPTPAQGIMSQRPALVVQVQGFHYARSSGGGSVPVEARPERRKARGS